MTFVGPSPPHILQTCYSRSFPLLTQRCTASFGILAGAGLLSTKNIPQLSLPIIIPLPLKDQLPCYPHHRILPDFPSWNQFLLPPRLPLDGFTPVITIHLAWGLARVQAFGIKLTWIRGSPGLSGHGNPASYSTALVGIIKIWYDDTVRVLSKGYHKSHYASSLLVGTTPPLPPQCLAQGISTVTT